MLVFIDLLASKSQLEFAFSVHHFFCMSVFRSLSDIDKDGRLSCDEYAIAMHLMSHVKGGVSLPSTLPPELYPGPVKYHTVDRVASKAKKVSMVMLLSVHLLSRYRSRVRP